MKFKNYTHREYERVFTGNELIKRKCDINKLSTFEGAPENITKYTEMFKKTMDDLHESFFNNLVKINWLIRRFCYNGKRREKMHSNGEELDRAFGVYIRYYVGHSMKAVFPGGFAGKIESYIDDFYPNFESNNPFGGEYKYPYKYMNLECLSLVCKMPERLDLLDYGEKMEMNYTKFLDYIINYISCYNGETYIFIYSHVHMPVIKLVNK